jgi:hypothetical protein
MLSNPAELKTEFSPSSRERLVLGVLFLLMALAGANFFFKTTVEFQKALIGDVLASQADLPWQHRLLSPLAIYGLLATLQQFRAAMNPEILFYAACLWASLYLYYFFLRDYFDVATALLCATLFLLIVNTSALLELNFVRIPPYGVRYCYDVSSPIFFIGLAYCACRKRLLLFYPLLVMGMFNRETVVLFIPLLFYTLWMKDRKSRALFHGLTTLVLAVGIKLFLMHSFPGAAAEFKLFHNLMILTGAKGFYPHFYFFMACLGLWIVAPFGYRSLSGDLKRLLIMACVGAALMLVFANIYEIRVYNELSLFIIPAGVAGIKRLIEEKA